MISRLWYPEVCNLELGGRSDRNPFRSRDGTSIGNVVTWLWPQHFAPIDFPSLGIPAHWRSFSCCRRRSRNDCDYPGSMDMGMEFICSVLDCTGVWFGSNQNMAWRYLGVEKDARIYRGTIMYGLSLLTFVYVITKRLEAIAMGIFIDCAFHRGVTTNSSSATTFWLMMSMVLVLIGLQLHTTLLLWGLRQRRKHQLLWKPDSTHIAVPNGEQRSFCGKKQ